MPQRCKSPGKNAKHSLELAAGPILFIKFLLAFSGNQCILYILSIMWFKKKAGEKCGGRHKYKAFGFCIWEWDI